MKVRRKNDYGNLQCLGLSSVGACIEHTVATTILKCKSEDQWRAVGIIQCSLRNSVATNLISTEVIIIMMNVKEVFITTSSYSQSSFF